jgi:hypothetical protein
MVEIPCIVVSVTRVSWALIPYFYLMGRQPSGTLLLEDGRLIFEGWLVVVKE